MEPIGDTISTSSDLFYLGRDVGTNCFAGTLTIGQTSIECFRKRKCVVRVVLDSGTQLSNTSPSPGMSLP